MQVVLLLAGIVAIGAGIATLLASVGNGTFDTGHPLITAGTIAVTGGFILLGLASVLMRLRQAGPWARRRRAQARVRPEALALPPELQPEWRLGWWPSQHPRRGLCLHLLAAIVPRSRPPTVERSELARAEVRQHPQRS